MASIFDIAALIEALTKLYSRIASLDLQKRIGSYQHRNGAGVTHDIATPLADDIDKLTISEIRDSQAAKQDTSLHRDPVATQTKPRSRQPTGRQPPKPTRRFKELSRFLGREKTASTLQPHVSHKLQASVWEHINTSLRLARQGEAKTAKLHADVANNALKEAARYMPEDEYAEFYGQVEKKLSEIRAEINARHSTARSGVG